MKNIVLPKELLNLPQPWAMTHPELRRQQLGLLNYEKGSIKTALNVLERSLHSLSQLTVSKTDCIPEDMITYWAFSAEWLAERIPTFDEFNLVKVEQFLMSDEGIDSPSPELIFDVAEYWVWWVTYDIEKAALKWVEDALMKTRERILISRFLNIAKRYWQKVQPPMAQSLLSSSAIIGWQKALPLFLSVEQNLAASEAVKETARDYREFVLDYPHRWLPEPQDKEELSANERLQLAQRRIPPALGQLAYVSQLGA
jgi:hypothetical protein